jgi:hypothetical protein
MEKVVFLEQKEEETVLLVAGEVCRERKGSLLPDLLLEQWR